MLATNRLLAPQPARSLQLRVAFATDVHARQAMDVIRTRPDLLDYAGPAADQGADAGLAVVEIYVDARNRERLMTLVSGLHGILIGVEGNPAMSVGVA